MDTKNWTQITMEKTDEVTLREYDRIIGMALVNIYSLSKDLRKIRLIDFNRKNREHLFVLRIALIARDIYDMPIEIEGSYWDIFCINWKIRKGFEKIKRANPFAINGIWVRDFLNFLRPEAIAQLGEKFTFDDIYEEYYEGSCG